MIAFIEKVKKSIKELFSIYPWMKLALASIVGVLGGSGFITFINKYAIYNYAVAYSGRLPVESVPYIDVAISILSFAFLAISFISALLIYGLLTLIAEALHKKFKNVPQTLIKMISGVITSLIGSVVSALASYFLKGGDFFSFFSADLLKSIIGILFVGGLLAALIIWKHLIRPFALLASMTLIMFVASSLFNAKNYASFLREIQYGGGVPVTVIYSTKNEEERGNLFLTTKTTCVVWNSAESVFVEIPVKSISKIKFHEEKEPMMPEIKGSIISIFRHLWVWS